MSVRRPLAVANWKLNGDLALVEQMAQALNAIDDTPAEMVICPAYPFVPGLVEAAKTFKVGAQNMSEHDKGAFTGEVSAAMLKGVGTSYVILGHSERRAIFNESDNQVADKFVKAVDAGLTPILCVGETQAERDGGLTETVIKAQVEAVIAKAGIDAFDGAVIAYEPVWAIGTGKTATTEQAQAVHHFIRTLVKTVDSRIGDKLPILYGGSVNGGNSAALFAQPDIDGGLVGGASLKVDDFSAICRSF